MELDRANYDAYTGPIQSHINVGSGEDITIRKLAELMGKVVEYEGRIELDANKPDGAPRKWLDITHRQHLGWIASTALKVAVGQCLLFVHSSFARERKSIRYDLESRHFI
jgi:GDP-L-fucose synthase